MLEYALRSLHQLKKLRRIPLGVIYYMDEGRDCRYSHEAILEAASRAKRVMVLRPGYPGDKIIVKRRGQRKYSLVVEGHSKRLGAAGKAPAVFLKFSEAIKDVAATSSRKKGLAISPVDVKTNAFPQLLPHRVTATLLMNFVDHKLADESEANMHVVFKQHGLKYELKLISDRPPMKERRASKVLAKSLMKVAEELDMPMDKGSALWPSVGGIVPAKIPTICGIGPVAQDLNTPQESISRISLIQRTLLIAQFLAKELEE